MLDALKPRLFVMGNVLVMASGSHNQLFSELLRGFQRAGYQLQLSYQFHRATDVGSQLVQLTSEPYFLPGNPLSSTHSISWTTDFYMDNESRTAQAGLTDFSAIAIPTETKELFECPWNTAGDQHGGAR